MSQPQNPAQTLIGYVQAGEGDAAHWLGLFSVAYSRKLGMPLFPGSLNLYLRQPFDWFAPALQSGIVWFGREEYGGDRDILLLACRLRSLDDEAAYLWTTATAARGRADPRLVEIVAPVGLRAKYGLRDGDEVVLELRILAEMR